LKNVEEEK